MKMQNVQTQGRQGIEGPMQGPLPQGVARGIEQQPAPGQRGFILDYHGPHGPRRDEPLKRAGQPLTQPSGSAGLKAPALGSQLKDKGLRSLPHWFLLRCLLHTVESPAASPLAAAPSAP